MVKSDGKHEQPAMSFDNFGTICSGSSPDGSTSDPHVWVFIFAKKCPIVRKYNAKSDFNNYNF